MDKVSGNSLNTISKILNKNFKDVDEKKQNEIIFSDTEPSSPSLNDIWFDTTPPQMK